MCTVIQKFIYINYIKFFLSKYFQRKSFHVSIEKVYTFFKEILHIFIIRYAFKIAPISMFVSKSKIARFLLCPKITYSSRI